MTTCTVCGSTHMKVWNGRPYCENYINHIYYRYITLAGSPLTKLGIEKNAPAK